MDLETALDTGNTEALACLYTSIDMMQFLDRIRHLYQETYGWQRRQGELARAHLQLFFDEVHVRLPPPTPLPARVLPKPKHIIIFAETER